MLGFWRHRNHLKHIHLVKLGLRFVAVRKHLTAEVDHGSHQWGNTRHGTGRPGNRAAGRVHDSFDRWETDHLVHLVPDRLPELIIGLALLLSPALPERCLLTSLP